MVFGVLLFSWFVLSGEADSNKTVVLDLEGERFDPALVPPRAFCTLICPDLTKLCDTRFPSAHRNGLHPLKPQARTNPSSLSLPLSVRSFATPVRKVTNSYCTTDHLLNSYKGSFK